MPTLSGPQVQVLRHTVDQIVVAVAALPRRPVPQTVDQLMGALLHLDTPTPEHAIFEVPKISCPSRFPRSVLRETQKAEQLVEVPTVVSLVEVFEQPIDIPVRAWGGTGGRLQGFSPWPEFFVCGADRRRSSSFHGIFGGFQGFHPGQSSTAVAEQIVDIPVLHGGLHLQDPGLALLSQEIAGEAFQTVFSTFPRRKKSAPLGPHSGSELSADFSSSSPPAQLASPFLREGFFEDESGGMWMRLPSGRWYLLCSDPEVFWDGPG